MKIFYESSHQEHNPPFEGFDSNGLKPAFEKAERADTVFKALQETSWAEFQSPIDFGPEPILAVHSAAYLDYLRSAYREWQAVSPVSGMAFIPGTYGIDYQEARACSGYEQVGFFLMDTTVAVMPGTFPAAVTAANCALSGAQALANGEKTTFALTRPPGHHAGREICGGYCFFNNAAIAAQWLSLHGQIAILDVDYHAGNGTQDIFYERADILTISLHADPADEYPYYAGFASEIGAGAGEGFHRNFPLPAGTDQPHYLDALARALDLIDQFGPKFLIVSAGMDTYKDEPQGNFKLTQKSYRIIGERIASLNLPSLVVMEGGYHLPSLGDNFVAFLEPFA
jgi:acetoin utilization deacetylase AcuC-like enzyme